MEALECGAAALAIVLGYYGKVVPLEDLRIACGVSRDGANAGNVVNAAKSYGLSSRGFQMDISGLVTTRMPLIVFWAFQHFMVVEGTRRRWGKTWVYVNDPATGPRKMEMSEFDDGYTGILLTFEPTKEFTRGGRKQRLSRSLADRWQSSQGLFPLLLLASLLLVVPGILTPAFTQVFLDSLSQAGLSGGMLGLMAAMTATAIMVWVLTAVQQRSLITLYTKLALSSAPPFMLHLLRLPITFFLQRQPAEVTRRVRGNNLIAELLSRDVATTAVSLVLVLFYAAVLVRYDLLLSIVGISVAVLNIAVLRTVSRIRTDSVARLRADRGNLVATSINAIKLIETIKSSGSENQSFRRWAGFQAKVASLEQRLGVPTAWLAAVPGLLSTVNTGLLLWIGGTRAIRGAVTVGLLVAFQTLLASLNRPITQLTNLGERLQDITAEVDRIRDVMGYEIDPAFTSDEPEKPRHPSGLVTVEALTFAYGPLSEPVLQDLTFELHPGRRTALVGDSGSGKSTVGKLIGGIYQPSSGRILLDERPREQYSRLELSTSVSYVEQDIFLFEGTIRDNITLWDDTVSEEAVISALRDAEIYDVVARRPGGVGSRVEDDGRNFSGGERQRLAIARALISSPSVLILDEATSALDAETERKVDDNLRRRGCACLIVAHRLSTVQDSDEIIVLRKGRALERGTHRELIEADGEYARLAQSS